MKRKIFSKLLMGAFLIASISSFVSCKDYDDDIKSINDKLATVALQTTVDNIQTQLQSAISAAAAAQKTADQAVAAAAAAQKTADAAATKDALALVDAAAKAAGEEAAKAIANAATAQTAAEAAQATADQAAAAAKAAQEAADAAAAAATAGTDAAKADAAAAAAAAAAAQKTADAAAEAAAKAASENKSATDAAAAVAAAAKEAADKASSETAALASQITAAQSAAEAAQKAADTAIELAKAASGKEIDLSNYITKDALATALKDYAKAKNDYATSTALKEEIKKVQDQIDAINNKIDGVDFDKVKNMVANYETSINELYTAVTNISLMVDDWTAEPWVYNIYPIKGRILANKNHFTTVKIADKTVVTAGGTTGETQNDGTFGKQDYYNNAKHNANTSVTFKDGEYFEFDQGSIVVRVSPTNANLDASMLRFIDSQGNDMSGAVKIVAVQPYGDYLTRATSNSGLWRVYYSLTKSIYNDEDLFKYTQTSGGADKSIAIAVNNTTANGTKRDVVSEYNIAFRGVSRYVGYTTLQNVLLSTNQNSGQGTLLANVSNRTINDATPTGKCNDYEWDTPSNMGKTVSAEAIRLNAAATANAGDYIVANGQTFYVKFDNYFEAGPAASPYDGNMETMTRPRYAYIILDKDNADLTNDASETNAWAHYDIQGINTLIDLNSTWYPSLKVTIPAGSKTGDEVAFRLFAVNWDGTLVDPDGIGFNVFVGSDKSSLTINHTFTATQALGQVVYVPMDGSKVVSNTKPNAAAVNPVAAGTFTHANNWFAHAYQSIEFVTTNKGNVGTNVATKWSDVKYARVVLGANAPADELCFWIDNLAASKSIALSSGDSKNTTDFTIVLNLTKTLPTAADVKKKYTWKESQLVGNVWTAVIYPETAQDAADASANTPWNDTPWGYKGLNNGINGLVKTDGSAYADENFVFTFANSVYNNSSKAYTDTKHIPGYAATGDVLTPLATYAPLVNTYLPDYVDGYILNLQDGANKTLSDLVDGTTQHASTIAYNYGHISSNPAGGYGDVNDYGVYAGYHDYVVVGENFQTVYACPFQDNTITVTCSPYKDGVKLNTVGNKVAVGDQAWNYVYYNDPTIGKNVYDNTATNNTFTDAGTDLGNVAFTDAKWLKVSSKLGAEFIVPTLNDYIGHFKNVKSATFISNGTKKEDYFTVDKASLTAATPKIKLVRNAGTNDPKVDVPSTLIIVGRCAFNHEHTIKIPFTVKTTAE
jgi:hypothetical protein